MLIAVSWATGIGGEALAANDPAVGPRATVVEVRPGDTTESLAATWYGKDHRDWAIFIREANGLGASRPRPGHKVRIPTATRVRVRRGDTMEGIARRLLGDGRRAFYLAQVNGLRPTDLLHVGSSLWVPFHLVHRAHAPESLAAIAKTFYGDAGQGKELLAPYNFRSSPLLSKGEVIVVPVPHVRIARTVESGPAVRRKKDVRGMVAETVVVDDVSSEGQEKPAVAKAGVVTPMPTEPAPKPPVEAPPPPAPGSAAEKLQRAERAFREGRYEEAHAMLVPLADGKAPSGQRASVHRLLAYIYVATGADADAVREFREMLAADPSVMLDPQSTSPKIRDAFERARGAQK